MVNISSFIQKIQQSDIGKRMASGALWTFTGTALAKCVVLIGGILCAHILTKEQYGELGMIRSTINMFVIFGYAGLGITATKYISEFKTEHSERIPSIYILTNGFAIIMGILVTAIVIFLAPFLADKTLNSPHLTPVIRFGALLLFFTVINGAQNGVLSGLEKFKAIALNNLCGGISETIFMLLGAYYWGVSGALLGYGTGFIILYFCNNRSIRREFSRLNIKIKFSMFQLKNLNILYKFSLPAALASFMVAPTYWIIRSFLVNHNGYEELAIYEAADQWKIIILFIPSAVSQIVLPILSNIVNNSKSKYWKVLKLNVLLNGGISTIFAIIICICSPIIIKFYGNTFTNYMPLIFLSLSTIFTSVTNVAGLAIASRAKMWSGFLFNLYWAFIVIFTSFAFIKCNYGATGVAISILISYIFLFLIQIIYLIRLNKTHRQE